MKHAMDDNQLDELLQGLAATASDVPRDVADRVRTNVTKRLRRRRQAMVTSVATMLIATGLATYLALWGGGNSSPPDAPVFTRGSFDPRPAHVPDSKRLPTHEIANNKGVTVTPPPSANVIAVPVPTDNPTVSIVWLHHTIQPDSRGATQNFD